MDRADDGASPDWILATEALRLVCERNGGADAITTLARRAHVGLVRARARLFVKEQPAKRGEKETISLNDAELPKEFWWAEGEASLVQDWEAGDFDTWINRQFRWQAFGVKFHRSGVEDILAPQVKMDAAEPIENLSQAADRVGERSIVKTKGRSLTHDHPYAAAKAVLDLVGLPKAERIRLNGPSIGRTMRDHYERIAGKSPHDDVLDNCGKSVLRALTEFWERE